MVDDSEIVMEMIRAGIEVKYEDAQSGQNYEMAEKKYMTDGVTCPWCGNLGVDSTSVPEFTGAQIKNDVRCDHCDQEWQETYKLVSFSPKVKDETDKALQK